MKGKWLHAPMALVLDLSRGIPSLCTPLALLIRVDLLLDVLGP